MFFDNVITSGKMSAGIVTPNLDLENSCFYNLTVNISPGSKEGVALYAYFRCSIKRSTFSQCKTAYKDYSSVKPERASTNSDMNIS